MFRGLNRHSSHFHEGVLNMPLNEMEALMERMMVQAKFSHVITIQSRTTVGIDENPVFIPNDHSCYSTIPQ